MPSSLLLLAAQTLFVSPQGPFDQIQTAIDAASPGDTIVVAPGTYAPIVVDKPLEILGAGSALAGATEIRSNGVDLGVLVEDLAPQDRVVLSGLRVRHSWQPQAGFCNTAQAVATVRDCGGSVVLHDCAFFADLKVLDSEDVSLTGSSVEGEWYTAADYDWPPFPDGNAGYALYVESSQVRLSQSTVRGGWASVDCPGFDLPVRGEPGLHAVGSVLELEDTYVRGGDAAGQPADGGDGIVLVGSTLRVRGGASAKVEGGRTDTIGTGLAGRALHASAGSTVERQAGVPFEFAMIGIQAGSPIETDPTSADTVLADAGPVLGVSPLKGALGQSFSLTLQGDPLALAVVYAGVVPTKGSLPLVDGALFLSPAAAVLLASTILDAAGQATVSLTPPANPALAPRWYGLQWVELTPTTVALSGPGGYVIEAP